MMTRYFVTKKGFTIPELLIIILVIGILSAVTFAAYNGLQQRALRAALQTDLKTAGNLMAQARLKNLAKEYPSTFPSELKVSDKTVLTLTDTGSATTFCINGTAVGLNEAWKFDNSNGLASGLCSGAALVSTEIRGSSSGVATNYVTDQNFTSSGWTFPKQSGTSTITTRAATASDPVQGKNVLVIQNNASTTSWSYIRGALTNPTSLSAGKPYTTSVWIRIAVGSSVGSNTAGVMDGSATNRVIDFGSAVTLDGTWRQLNNTRTASINGLSTSIFYIWLNASHMNQNATIELQQPILQ